MGSVHSIIKIGDNGDELIPVEITQDLYNGWKTNKKVTPKRKVPGCAFCYKPFQVGATALSFKCQFTLPKRVVTKTAYFCNESCHRQWAVQQNSLKHAVINNEPTLSHSPAIMLGEAMRSHASLPKR